ncbi:MAG: PilZ domain-containing protein [Phycisphaerae bacterium]
MAESHNDIHGALAALAAALEEGASTRGDVPAGEEHRRQQRHQIRGTCEVCFFRGPGMHRLICPAATRNVSFTGISVVLDLQDPVAAKRPVELSITTPDGVRTYLAGVVAFCRRLDDGMYELGVDVNASGTRPILTDDIITAQVTHAWFAEALKVPEEP